MKTLLDDAAPRSPLDPLLQQRRDLWRGNRVAREQPTVPSGHAALDALLPGGGWPLGVLTEICCAHAGMGEISLLLPALARLDADARWLAWVAPPHPLYAPALSEAGIDPARCLLIEPPQAGLRHAPARTQQALWAAEQLLRGGACGAVLLWWDGEDANALRRLQLAAEAGRSLAVLFRPEAAAQRLSPAALRLRLDADGSFEIIKCRGGDWRAERGQKLRMLARQPRWRDAVPAAGVAPRTPLAQASHPARFSRGSRTDAAGGATASRQAALPLLRAIEAPTASTPAATPAPPVDTGAADAKTDWRAQARRERQRRS